MLRVSALIHTLHLSRNMAFGNRPNSVAIQHRTTMRDESSYCIDFNSAATGHRESLSGSRGIVPFHFQA